MKGGRGAGVISFATSTDNDFWVGGKQQRSSSEGEGSDEGEGAQTVERKKEGDIGDKMSPF